MIMNEMAEDFMTLGIRKTTAKVLTCLMAAEGNRATSRKLEWETGLRQPEVSLALHGLQEWGWVTKTTERTGEGRIFRLAMDPKEIIAQVEAKYQREHGKAESAIQRIRQATPA